MRVLVVEDNPGDQLLIDRALHKLRPGLEVQLAGDGVAALALLRATAPPDDRVPPDFVLLDLKLPKKSGLDVLREMKQDPQLKRIPVIVLTSSDAPSDIASAYDNHASAYIAKHAVDFEGTAARILDFMEALEFASHGPDKPGLSPLLADPVAREPSLAEAPNAQLMAAIVESSADAILSLDLEGLIISWNRAAEHLYGYTAAEAIGRDVRLIVERERVPELRAVLAAVRRREPVQHLETVRVDRAGRKLTISLAISPIHDRFDRVVGAATVARDVTGSKQAEERFRLAVESSPNAMVMCDQDGAIVLVNAETERLFGYARDELVGKSIEILVPERFRTAHPGRRAGFMGAPAARSMGAGRDLFAVCSDGTELPVEIGLNPIETPEGVFVLAAIVDITERKQAEERFRLAVEASPNGHVMVDEDGMIVMINAEAERMFGYDRNELMGREISVLVPARFRGQHPHHRAAFMKQPAARAMGAGRDLYGERKDGSEFPIEIGLNPIETPAGTFVLSAIVDITERKQTEHALARQTHELARSNAELEQFAYVASHDLREPLRTVASFTHLLQREYGAQLDEQAQTYIQFAVDASQRMQQLISDLLTYARLSTRVDPPMRVELAGVVDVVLANLQLAIEESGAIVRVAELPVIVGVESQLMELFQNVIANALKFRGELPPRIEVGARRSQDGWTISIEDNGIGIAREHRESVFQVFRRLHLREEYSGTGIGLALCKRIVERHGGRIWIDASQGQGTTVSFTLPAGGI